MKEPFPQGASQHILLAPSGAMADPEPSCAQQWNDAFCVSVTRSTCSRLDASETQGPRVGERGRLIREPQCRAACQAAKPSSIIKDPSPALGSPEEGTAVLTGMTVASLRPEQGEEVGRWISLRPRYCAHPKAETPSLGQRWAQPEFLCWTTCLLLEHSLSELVGQPH